MEILETLDTYCPYCDVPVAAPIVNVDDVLEVKGEAIFYRARVAKCPLCDEVVADSRVEKENVLLARRRFCEIHGIVEPSQIEGLRSEYGLSLREFSKFLGFGEQTVARYELGDIPDVLHSNTLKLAESAEGARFLLEVNGSLLNAKSAEKVEWFIAQRKGDDWVFDSMFSFEDAPSPDNGFREFDVERLRALVIHLAHRCDSLYKTKLQKALYICDALCYERNVVSLTGSRYVRAPYGPVLQNYDAFLCMLAMEGDIAYEQEGWGEIVRAQVPEHGVFTEGEMGLIDEVVCFVNGFGSAGEISEWSHGLSAWRNARSGTIIPYDLRGGEVGAAMSARLEGRSE